MYFLLIDHLPRHSSCLHDLPLPFLLPKTYKLLFFYLWSVPSFYCFSYLTSLVYFLLSLSSYHSQFLLPYTVPFRNTSSFFSSPIVFEFLSGILCPLASSYTFSSYIIYLVSLLCFPFLLLFFNSLKWYDFLSSFSNIPYLNINIYLAGQWYISQMFFSP